MDMFHCQSLSQIHQYIFNHFKKFKNIEEFLCLEKYLLLPDDDITLTEEELFRDMTENKMKAQALLNLYKNYNYYHNFKIVEDFKSRGLSFVNDETGFLSNGYNNNSTISPYESQIIDYIANYLLSHMALGKLDQIKNNRNMKSVLQTVCFFCDSALDDGRCDICATNSIDMRQYAQMHFQTLQRERNDKIAINDEDSRTSLSSDIKESENSINSWSENTTDDGFLSNEITTEHNKSTENVAQKLIIDDNIKLKEEQNYWNCELCTFLNKSESLNCESCYKVKDNGDKTTNVMTEHICEEKEGLESYNKRVKETCFSGKWMCWNPHCFKVNDHKNHFCIKCGFQRKITRSFIRLRNGYKTEFWMCDICSHINEKRRNLCYKCKKCSKKGCTMFWSS